MKNLKIGKKLLITFGIIILLLLVVALTSIISLVGNGDKFKKFYENGYNVTNEVMDLQVAIQSSAKYIGYSMMTSDIQKTNEYIQNAKSKSDTMKDSVNKIREIYTGDQTLVKAFDAALSSIADARNQVYEYASSNKNTQASELYFSQVMPGYLEANDYLSQIYDSAKQIADNNYKAAEQAELFTVILIIILSVATLLITIFLAIYITSSLTKPIKEIEQIASDMADGNLNVDLSYQSKDELGNLSDKIRTLVKRLKAIIGDESHLLGEMANGNFKVTKRIMLEIFILFSCLCARFEQT